ncbi:uncharacterized protein LOC127410264 isoform X1 [Myxocyprinus asiaticus]|uniref:uncharacterized protein LOC127410264 isoform X1 n=1 Tax=Myxocyprinus asiaticus TaxID=70543 RepID=UPI002223CC02|nr:uncharacterized protein LOC127410264 isoform X1 [Myxocyprinus asiaticus]
MTDVEPVVSDFAATGRTGRRNALPDILGSTAGPGASDLPDKLAEVSVAERWCNVICSQLKMMANRREGVHPQLTHLKKLQKGRRKQRAHNLTQNSSDEPLEKFTYDLPLLLPH